MFKKSTPLALLALAVLAIFLFTACSPKAPSVFLKLGTQPITLTNGTEVLVLTVGAINNAPVFQFNAEQLTGTMNSIKTYREGVQYWKTTETDGSVTLHVSYDPTVWHEKK